MTENETMIAKLGLEIEHLKERQAEDRTRFEDSLKSSADSRTKMHSKIDEVKDLVNSFVTKFQWWLVGFLGAMVMQTVFFILTLSFKK